jgi:hypothetical protein
MKSEKTGQKPLENDEQPLDPHTLTASFPVKFVQGSRKSPVALKFGIQVPFFSPSFSLFISFSTVALAF